MSGAIVAASASINVPNSATPGLYNININTQDITGAPSSTLTMALTVSQDFAISSLTPTTQTITVGESASYNFSVLPVGTSFIGAVTLSCSSTPVISALCNFTPNPVTPGNTSAAVVMTINTTSSSANLTLLQPGRAAFYYALWMMLPGLLLLGITKRRGKHTTLGRLTFLVPLLVLAWSLSSCGGGGSNGGGGGEGGGQGQGTQPGTYTISVSGTSGALSHAASSTVILVVSQ